MDRLLHEIGIDFERRIRLPILVYDAQRLAFQLGPQRREGAPHDVPEPALAPARFERDQVRQQRGHPSLQPIDGLDDRPPALGEVPGLACPRFVHHLGGGPDAGERVADVVRDHRHQGPEGGPALRLDQNALALGELAGHLAEGRGELPDLPGAFGRDPVVEMAPADLDRPIDQIAERDDEARLQAAPREQQERHREHHRHRHHHRRPPRPARALRVERLPARCGDGFEDRQGALQLAEHPLLVSGVEELHARRLGDLVGIGEHLLHVVEHDAIGVVEVVHGGALVLAVGELPELREVSGDLPPVSGVRLQRGRVFGQPGVGDLVKLAVRVAPHPFGQAGQLLDARRLLGGLGPEPGPQPGQGRRHQDEDEERGFVEQQQTLERVGENSAHWVTAAFVAGWPCPVSRRQCSAEAAGMVHFNQPDRSISATPPQGIRGGHRRGWPLARLTR